MTKKISLLLLCLSLILGGFLPVEKTLAANATITIAAETVNIRSGPGLSYKLVKQVKKGEKFIFKKEQGDWIEIELSIGKTGWVANWVVTKTGGESTPPSGTSMKATAKANTDQLRVRSGPGTNFRIIGNLTKGQAITVLAENENWLKIEASFGEGWVSRQYVDMKSTTKTTTTKTDPNSIANTKGMVTALLNVRDKPSSSSTVVGKVASGTSIKIFSKQSNWLEIEFNGQKAWVSADYVQTGEKTSQVSGGSGPIGTVTASNLSVRTDPSLDSSVIGSIQQGQTFTIVDEKNNWVKIEYKPGTFGWAAGWYFSKGQSKSTAAPNDSKITILHNGTNIRSSADGQASVLLRANEGESFAIKSVKNDWYEITLANGVSGYVAGWIVTTNTSSSRIEKQGAGSYLKYKTIVIDPGHGGIDNGATGVNGTLEKELTLRTAKLLSDKLKAAGATVFLTRSNDSFLPLPSRVRIASIHQADAFISLHYDSNLNRSVRGMTGYYYHSYQKQLAEYVYNAANAQTKLKSRGVRQGNYHVIRENRQPSVLMELGYLSNLDEEMMMRTGQFQENAATGLFNGLARYFKEM
ncbi:SH3 domain-containing protein [Bacillus sp. MRMR6]|uniref:SH3 domain-containing protein n=1 Tax=Bacillus sp. MRMR6 TaxID=1928617 RepID=UPI000951923E|nr:SH3 domain-containing protein [Bacillus sp. MRMR6]OLS41578.1 N-acetylmuramoyl-L-alanine amidase [Bacillus sp. MRMR6]